MDERLGTGDSGGVSNIRVMSDTLASQVAAGEVVERPASVIKELVENSLDAGARHITVEFARGGAASMKVSDDGSGMTPADARMSLERHATSKLRETDDLATVMTMGFRGEAMPSVASVSRMRILTRTSDALSGMEIVVDGGQISSEKEAGCAAGTTVEVRELFYNIPARRKFLKAETTESAHIEHQVRLHALAYPEVRFTLKKDGRTVFDLPGTQDARVRISALAGPAAMKDLIEVRPTLTRGITVGGYVLKANHARSGRRHQFLFLNHRPIEDALVSGAIRDGFGSLLATGHNPPAWLWLEMPARSVDINVHPAKREVRFHKGHDVRMAVTDAIAAALKPKQNLSGSAPTSPLRAADQLAERMAAREDTAPPTHVTREREIPESRPEAPTSTAHAPPTSQPNRPEPTEAPAGRSLVPPVRHEPVQPELTGTEEAGKKQQGHSFRVIGPLSDQYFVLQNDDGMVLLDPVSSAERVIYEQMLAAESGHGVATQGLLVPLVLEVDERDKDVVLRHALHFSTAGIDVSDFGAGVVQVTGVPAFLKDVDAKALLLEFIDELAESGGILRREMAYERFAGKLAGVTARRRGFPSSQQAEQLLDALYRCDLPYCGADGRPTLVQLSLQELDRRFRRK